MLTCLALILGPAWWLKRSARIRTQDVKYRIMARILEADRVKWDSSPTQTWEVRRVA